MTPSRDAALAALSALLSTKRAEIAAIAAGAVPGAVAVGRADEGGVKDEAPVKGKRTEEERT